MVQPTDVAVGMLLALWLDLASWGLVIYGAALVIGGLIAIGYLIVTWGGVTLGPDPVIPPVVEPPSVPIVRPPKSHAARDDADTHVIPRIPGATPELEAFTEAIEQAEEQLSALAAFAAIPGLRVIQEPEPITEDLLARVRDGLKDSSDEESGETQVVDLCPLTTQDIEIDSSAPHFAETFTRHPRAELGTQELSGSLARAKESAA